MKKNNDTVSGIATILLTSLAVAGLSAINSSSKKDGTETRKKKKAYINQFGASGRVKPRFARLVRANTIEDEMSDLQTFDPELVKDITEMDYVVTHVFSESCSAYTPFTLLGISSSEMPPFDRMIDSGEYRGPNQYNDLLDTDLLEKKAKENLIDTDFTFDGIRCYDNPHECLKRIYESVRKSIILQVYEARPSQKSSIGCYAISMDNGDVAWDTATARTTSSIDEIIFECYTRDHFLDKDLFNIVSMILKMELITIIEMNTFSEYNEYDQ